MGSRGANPNRRHPCKMAGAGDGQLSCSRSTVVVATSTYRPTDGRGPVALLSPFSPDSISI